MQKRSECNKCIWLLKAESEQDTIVIAYMRHIPVMADLSHRDGGRGAPTAHRGDVGGLCLTVKVLQETFQCRNAFTLHNNT